MRKWKMNKQELIEKYKDLYENVFDFGARAACQLFLKDLEQLDEPEKVKVPQFVADWIEYFKKTGDWDLFQAMDYLFGKKEIREWLEDKNNQETFALAWIFGYEVEEEKRYVVKVKGNIKENMLVYGEFVERYFFTKSSSLYNIIYSHTHKELEEAGFDWVFNCEGIEIEEVE